jgi:hypothetical protein
MKNFRVTGFERTGDLKESKADTLGIRHVTLPEFLLNGSPGSLSAGGVFSFDGKSVRTFLVP